MSELATRIAATIAVAIVMGAGLWWWASREPDRITVVSWGGEYQQAQARALFHPYTDDTGVEVNVGLYGGGTAELTHQLETGHLEWDVVDFELPDAAEACRRGLIETIDPADLPPGDDGAQAADDFVPGALGKCWVGSVVYSQVVAFDPGKFAQALPQRAADFFDLAAFPGGRGMKDAPKGNLELALIAAGVPPRGIYEVLSTPEGVARAFAKLESVRAAIVWWQSSDEPIAMLADGRATMTTALNGRVADAVTKQHRNIGVIWDGQRYELDVFGIVRGSTNREFARGFIRYATGTLRLANVSDLLPYGPARRSSVRQAVHSAASPTAHMGTAVLIDPDWWAVHGPAIEARWQEWRAGH